MGRDALIKGATVTEDENIEILKGILKSLTAPKSVKEAALRIIRAHEKRTGGNVVSRYNGGK